MGAEVRPEITRAPVTAIVIGLAAGVFSALLGVGGGLIMVPAMVYLLRIRQHRAHGTSLVVILPAAIAGVSQYAEQGNVDWRIALLLAIGGVGGAVVGARLSAAIRAPDLKRFFGIFVVVTGMLMIIFPSGQWRHGAHTLLGDGALGSATIIVVGLAAGIISGLLGVGGGIIMVPAAVYLLGLDQHTAQGISLAVIIPVAISGALIHYAKGNVIPSIALWLAIGATVGAYVTGHWVRFIPSGTLRTLFGIFLVIVGVWMVGRRGQGSSRLSALGSRRGRGQDG
jgi:uncharacterized membrane protein YfcA